MVLGAASDKPFGRCGALATNELCEWSNIAFILEMEQKNQYTLVDDVVPAAIICSLSTRYAGIGRHRTLYDL
eukprot:scaffold2011_cov22-Tisochrysis_lutea.AAC.7